MYHYFFLHSSVNGHLGYFHVLDIGNSVSMYIRVQASFQIMVFSGYMSRSGITGSLLRLSYLLRNLYTVLCFPGGSAGKESTCNVGDLGSIPGLGRSRGGGHGNPLQYSGLENPHGQRSLVGYSSWGHKKSATTER